VDEIAEGVIPLDFDIALCTSDMLPSLKKVARILGPKQLFPNLKTKTIRDDIALAVQEIILGKVT